MQNLKLLFMLFGLFLFSCSEKTDLIVLNEDENKFLEFKDVNEFYSTYLELSNYSTEKLEEWLKDKDHDPFLNSQNSHLINYSNTLQAILNKDQAMVIGDEVIWLVDSKFYSCSKTNYSNEIRSKNLGKPRGFMNSGNESLENRTVSLKANSTNAQNQMQFVQQYYQPCGTENRLNIKGNRKYVHEIYDETLHLGNGFFTRRIALRLKLEWKGSGSWKPAGEQRIMNVNVSGTSGGQTFSHNQIFDCSGNQELLLSGGIYITASALNVSMTGSIVHRVKGDDPVNTYNNIGVLW